MDGRAVEDFVADARPEFVFLAAAKVGGLVANDTTPADYIRENLGIGLNVISAAHRYGVGKLLYLGSACAYPKHASQPIREGELLSGPLEPTNEAYAVAKIAGIKMCEAYRRQHGCNFICAMPTNSYGPEDNFDPETSHVIPSLIRRLHRAKVRGDGAVTVWGTGKPTREFLHVEDLADACVFLMCEYDEAEPINVGAGKEISILELARLVREIVGFTGALELDGSKPDGTPRRMLDVSRMDALGWSASTRLREGITATYEWYLEKHLRLSGS